MSEFKKYIKWNNNFIPLEKATFTVKETDFPEEGLKGKSLEMTFDGRTVNLGKLDHRYQENEAISSLLISLIVKIQFKD